MTFQDQCLIAITCWRENRGGQPQPAAMQSVVNVIMNRAAAHSQDPYTVCTTHAQFSSISMPGPEADLWPLDFNPQWQQALALAAQAAAGTLDDITDGSTLYYAPADLTPTEIEGTFTLPDGTTIPWVKGWNQAAVEFKVRVAGQVFFREI
jgi:hypothetical protein